MKNDDCDYDPHLEEARRKDATRRPRSQFAAGGIPAWQKDWTPPVTVADIKSTNPKDVVGTRKAPMSTVPSNVMAELGVAMLEGASKYGRHNYRIAGVRASVYYDALQRHIMAWWEGEDVDPESGLSHVTKAIATLVVLRDAMMQRMLTDDRPPKSVEFYTSFNAKSAALIDKYKEMKPRHYTIEDEREE